MRALTAAVVGTVRHSMAQRRRHLSDVICSVTAGAAPADTAQWGCVAVCGGGDGFSALQLGQPGSTAALRIRVQLVSSNWMAACSSDSVQRHELQCGCKGHLCCLLTASAGLFAAGHHCGLML